MRTWRECFFICKKLIRSKATLYNFSKFEVDIMLRLKVFDRNHKQLDEINEFSGLKSTWTLNGVGASTFSVGLESFKCTERNFGFRNHMEIWGGSGCEWGGQIIDQGFSGGKLNLACYGYLSLAKWRRLRAKTYAEKTYGALISEMLSDINNIAESGISLGTIESGSLLTQRKVEDKDYFLDKMQEFIQDTNYDIDIDECRKLNFYLRKGSDKPYVLEYGGKADNILKEPSLSRSIQNTANSVYSEVETDGTVLTSTASDSKSIQAYGLMEGSYSANSGIILQNTLDNYTQGELQRRAYSTNALQLKVKDSGLCPFSDIQVGDSVIVSIIPYWNYRERLRIIEMTHNYETGERDIVVGQTLYRPQAPKIRLYRK